MTKDEVLSELHALIDTRLFGDEWLVTRETAHVVGQRLTALGLQEAGQSRDTALGREINMKLMMVFIGTWDGGVLIRPTARQSSAAPMVDYCAGVLNPAR